MPPDHQPPPTTSSLGSNVARTRQELAQFVASLQGKSAAEAMGVVTQSHLVRATAISFVIQFVLVLAITALVYAITPANQPPPPEDAEQPTPTTQPIRRPDPNFTPENPVLPTPAMRSIDELLADPDARMQPPPAPPVRP